MVQMQAAVTAFEEASVGDDIPRLATRASALGVVFVPRPEMVEVNNSLLRDVIRVRDVRILPPLLLDHLVRADEAINNRLFARRKQASGGSPTPRW